MPPLTRGRTAARCCWERETPPVPAAREAGVPDQERQAATSRSRRGLTGATSMDAMVGDKLVLTIAQQIGGSRWTPWSRTSRSWRGLAGPVVGGASLGPWQHDDESALRTGPARLGSGQRPRRASPCPGRSRPRPCVLPWRSWPPARPGGAWRSACRLLALSRPWPGRCTAEGPRPASSRPTPPPGSPWPQDAWAGRRRWRRAPWPPPASAATSAPTCRSCVPEGWVLTGVTGDERVPWAERAFGRLDVLLGR